MIEELAQLAIKAETVEGTAETLAAADVVLVEEPKVSVITQSNKRLIVGEDMSPYSSVIAGQRGSFTGKFAIKGSGSAGVAPDWDRLMLGAGAKKTVTTGVSVGYGPLDTNLNATGTSYTLQQFFDGKFYKLQGSRGNIKLVGEASGLLYGFYDYQGVLVDVDDASEFSGFSPDSTNPVPFENLATPFSIHSYEALISKWEMDFGNKLEPRKDVNALGGVRSYRITGRRAVGSIDPEEVAKGTMDWWASLLAGTEGVLTFVLGAVAGNIVTVNNPKTKLDAYEFSVRDGSLAPNLPVEYNRSSGNDEWAITLT